MTTNKPVNKSRRWFMMSSAAVAPAVALHTPLIHAEDQSASSANTSTDSKNYQPQYFTADEWAFLQAACDRLIPDDDVGPGAVKAGVPEYIDRQMLSPYGSGDYWYMSGPFVPDSVPELGYQLKFTPKEAYRHGIKDVNDYTQTQFKKAFHQLSEEQQIAVLTDLEEGKATLTTIPAKTFFSFLWGNTREGFLADPQYGGNKNMVGWKAVGFPGARADFMDWVDQFNKPYPFPPVSIAGRRGK